MKNKNCPICAGEIKRVKEGAFCKHCGNTYLIFFKNFYVEEINILNKKKFKLFLNKEIKIDLNFETFEIRKNSDNLLLLKLDNYYFFYYKRTSNYELSEIPF